jgi:hypothetical protein
MNYEWRTEDVTLVGIAQAVFAAGARGPAGQRNDVMTDYE